MSAAATPMPTLSPADPLLELDHLHVSFGDTVAVDDVTLAIERDRKSVV